MEFERNRDQIEVEEWFPYVFSKLGEIEWMEFSLRSDEAEKHAPRFCWRYRRTDSSAYDRVAQAVSDFRGKVLWRFDLNWQRCCIWALPYSETRNGETPPESGLNSTDTHEALSSDRSFRAIAISEIPKLCQYIEQRLGLRDVAPKAVPSVTSAPSGIRRRVSIPRDLGQFVEPGMHTVWLVTDPAEFEAGSADSLQLERRLKFGLTDQEWRAICSQVIDSSGKAAHLPPAARAQTVEANPGTVRARTLAYRMLSRARGYRYDLIYETAEVRLLRQECQTAMTRTSNPDALRGLDKLSRICAEAIRLGLGIYMASG
jgi:hypothetical protein